MAGRRIQQSTQLVPQVHRRSPRLWSPTISPRYASDLFGLAVGGNGTIYATSVNSPDVIYAIDPTTGDATIIAGDGIGGTTFGALSYGIAVYPSISSVPEPSSGMMLALGVTGLLFIVGDGRNGNSSPARAVLGHQIGAHTVPTPQNSDIASYPCHSWTCACRYFFDCAPN